MVVNDECKCRSKEAVSDKPGSPDDNSYDKFTSSLPVPAADECRYAVYDFEDRLKRELDGIQVELQATSEMSLDIVKARAS
ncbi:hypothetical protein SASPL_116126 [Salvia splendens]|uniref:Uncharacterized protein n=1 Tax=Salvia splendens TaxID=180675 RepID=A0A8X8Y516_SALSN|nr:hypothetical protein SASPL_116126 [Salvia splendens]